MQHRVDMKLVHAAFVSTQGQLDFTMVMCQTDISERIRSPRYPFAVDAAAVRRGAELYQGRCAAYHHGPEDDTRLHAVEQIGTEPRRAQLFTLLQADRFNTFLAALRTWGIGEKTLRKATWEGWREKF